MKIKITRHILKKAKKNPKILPIYIFLSLFEDKRLPKKDKIKYKSVSVYTIAQVYYHKDSIVTKEINYIKKILVAIQELKIIELYDIKMNSLDVKKITDNELFYVKSNLSNNRNEFYIYLDDIYKLLSLIQIHNHETICKVIYIYCTIMANTNREKYCNLSYQELEKQTKINLKTIAGYTKLLKDNSIIVFGNYGLFIHPKYGISKENNIYVSTNIDNYESYLESLLKKIKYDYNTKGWFQYKKSMIKNPKYKNVMFIQNKLLN